MAPRTRTPVTGKFKPTKRRPLGPEEHHVGWDRALEDALKNIGWPRGQHQAQVEFGALIDVTNPGHVIEYHVTVI
jgi:hypothetical protein